jgi:flagellar basal body-associated protein FliL
MKGIVLLIVGVILLIGAGVGGWVVYTKFVAPPPNEEAEKAKPPPPPPPPVYVRVPPLIVPVIGSQRVEQQITLVVTLQVADQTMAAKVQEKMPWITHTFFTALYGAIDEGAVLSGPLVNIPGVKAKLLSVCNRILGKDVVQEVLVQTLLQRRL